MRKSDPASTSKVYKKKQKVRKTLLCPKCGRGRLIDESIGITSEVRAVEDDDLWEADYYTKCNVCKAEVGVRKIE